MITHGLSVDLEEFYHAANIKDYFKSPVLSRVQASTEKVLEIFEQNNALATFFVLGQVAESHPDLIRTIKEQGHEIASHGQNHFSVFEQTPEEFYQDISYSKKLIEDTIGEKISGYRAPNFSIIKNYEWAWDKVIKAGFSYDASVYPIVHDRYSNAHLPRTPFWHQSKKLLIIPAATAEACSLRLPIAGGAYWRILPLFYSKLLLKRVDSPAFCYFHPWELDYEQTRAKGLSLVRSLRHYFGLKGFAKRLDLLCKTFQFRTYSELIPN